MSTEHQQYSLDNQSMAIRKYAEAQSFEVVRTYSDAAKSGVVLRHRSGLRQLLKDVVEGAQPYRAWLERGKRLVSLSQFCDAVKQVGRAEDRNKAST
jgi:DNA invertase Pin-like site-specific DNA recombinase